MTSLCLSRCELQTDLVKKSPKLTTGISLLREAFHLRKNREKKGRVSSTVETNQGPTSSLDEAIFSGVIAGSD